ncbi:hypothetical protein QJQ45_011455 [Haematococcus lacustris]|nr:hypothetical protein QJQ45_011455 [Haematococcus lacustris]
MREYVFNPDTQIGVGTDPGVTQCSDWDERSGQLVTDQLRRWKLIKGSMKQASGLNNSRRDTERWLAPFKPHLQHLAAASLAGTSLEANLKHITVTLATWDAVWEVYLDPKQVEQRLVRPAWSQQRDQSVRGLMWCPVVAPRKPQQAPCSSQAATQPAALEPGPSNPRQPSAARAPVPQPGRWVDRDCNAAFNMQRIRESRWRPLELCWWPDQGALPAKGKEYPGLGYKRLRDKSPKAQQQQQQQPAVAQ